MVEIETVENNLRFSGQYYDAETGLHYNWWRYYDPGWGRYLRKDPIQNDPSKRMEATLTTGGNDYSYSANNPIVFIDFNGLELSGPLVRRNYCFMKAADTLIDCMVNAFSAPLAAEVACVTACAGGCLIANVAWGPCFTFCFIGCTAANSIYALIHIVPCYKKAKEAYRCCMNGEN